MNGRIRQHCTSSCFAQTFHGFVLDIVRIKRFKTGMPKEHFMDLYWISFRSKDSKPACHKKFKEQYIIYHVPKNTSAALTFNTISKSSSIAGSSIADSIESIVYFVILCNIM